MKVAVILPAAGLGTRMAKSQPDAGTHSRKQFLQLEGVPILLHTIRKFARCASVGEIVVALRGDDIAWVQDLLDAEQLAKPVRLVVGGDSRQQSVENALSHLDAGTELVAVHDAVRPFVELDAVEKVIEEAAACGAAILGTLAGLVLTRFGPFRGRALLSAMTTAPLVMPEVIMGIAMLLLFVALEQMIGWPEGRGLLTITIAHVTFTMAYVTVVVQSRLAGFDDALEEAALDLGAKPATVFFKITLPLIMPAIVSGWLLAFTLSWDDVVISQFVSGPGSSTLPMEIFSRVRRGVSPDINALATIMVLIVATGVVASTIWMKRQERKRALEEQMARSDTP